MNGGELHAWLHSLDHSQLLALKELVGMIIQKRDLEHMQQLKRDAEADRRANDRGRDVFFTLEDKIFLAGLKVKL